MARKRRKRHGKKRRVTKAVRRALAKARAQRKRNLRSGRGNRHRVKGYRARRRKKGWRVRGHMSREEEARRRRGKRRPKRRKHGRRRRVRETYEVAETRRRGRRRGRRRHALENPLSGMELLVGGIAGTVGYAVADVVDRLIVTRKRTEADGTTQKPMGFPENPLLDDPYARIGAGVALAAVPLVTAQFIRGPKLRSALQFAGFGAGVKLLGKAVDDLAAYMLKDSAADSKFKTAYYPEVQGRTAVGFAALPPKRCGTCGRTDGLGACCKSMYAQHPSLPVPPPTPQAVPPPPVSITQPQPYLPPAITVTEPLTPLTPLTPMTPQTPVLTPRPPAGITPSAPPIGAAGPLAGIQQVANAIRAHAPVARALGANRDAFQAYAAGRATPQQHAVVSDLYARHGQAIQTLGAIPQHLLNEAIRVYGTAALGLDGEPTNSRPGFHGWSHLNDAAE